MTLLNPESGSVREAAKILLTTPDSKLVMVQTSLLNVPGGGIEPGQQVTDALFDEINQETRGRKEDIVDLKPVGTVEGGIKNGHARWFVYSGRLAHGHAPLEPSAEVKTLHFMTPKEALAYADPMSDLARRAIEKHFFS